MRLAELLKEAGLPDGVFNVVHCSNEDAEQLYRDPRIAAVSFVGSSGVAEHIYKTASAYGKRVQAFGAAKNHAIVMPDADLDATVNAYGRRVRLGRRALHGAAGGGRRG